MNAKLKVLKSDLTLQVAFSQPFWQLFHNMPALYGPLLKQLGEYGLHTADIRTDAGDGTLGGFNVNFWLLNFGMLVRVRLESVEIQADLRRVAVDQLAPATDALLKAVRMASPEVKFLTYWVTLGIHGHIDGVNINEFLAKFTTNAPAGSGPVVGSGCVFYYGQQDPIITSALTLEPSGLFKDALFVRPQATFNADQVTEEELSSVVQKHVESVFVSLALEITE